MIQLNELRIGNIVECKNYVGKITVFNNDSVVIKHKSGIEKNKIDLLNPIPLREKWLLKFGFEKQMAWTYCIEINNQLLVYYLGEKGWSIGNKNYSDFSNLKYVHQLQNLYFALTNEELTYTP